MLTDLLSNKWFRYFYSQTDEAVLDELRPAADENAFQFNQNANVPRDGFNF